MITMPECPYCGKWFKTKRGLEQHITKVHKVNTPFGKALDYSSFDFVGKMRREQERAERRAKRKKDPLALGFGSLFGGSSGTSKKKKSTKKKSSSSKTSKKRSSRKR